MSRKLLSYAIIKMGCKNALSAALFIESSTVGSDQIVRGGPSTKIGNLETLPMTFKQVVRVLVLLM